MEKIGADEEGEGRPNRRGWSSQSSEPRAGGAEGALGALLVEGDGLPVAALGRHLLLESDASDARRLARGRSGPLEQLAARPRCAGRGHVAGGL